MNPLLIRHFPDGTASLAEMQFTPWQSLRHVLVMLLPFSIHIDDLNHKFQIWIHHSIRPVATDCLKIKIRRSALLPRSKKVLGSNPPSTIAGVKSTTLKDLNKGLMKKKKKTFGGSWLETLTHYLKIGRGPFLNIQYLFWGQDKATRECHVENANAFLVMCCSALCCLRDWLCRLNGSFIVTYWIVIWYWFFPL